MNNDLNTELLIRLMDGELPEPERAELLERLEKDPALQNQWQEITLHQELIRQYGRKGQLASVHTEMMTELAATAALSPGKPESLTPVVPLTPARTFRINLLRAVAAVLLLLLAAGLYPYFSATPEKLFSDRFQGYPLTDLRGTEPSAIASDYKEGNGSKTAADYRAGLSTGPQDDFLAGNAFLQLNQPGAAAGALLAAMAANQAAGTHYLEPDIQYYLGLAWLAAGEPKKALPLFAAIHADGSHPYNEKVSWWFLQKVKRLAAR